MRISPRMGLRIWTEFKDLYNHEQLASNFSKLDVHDHTEGRGIQIPTGGIAAEAITASLVASEAITEAKLLAAVAKRLLKETITYSTEKTLAVKTTATPSVTRNSIVTAVVELELSKETGFKIKVGTNAVAEVLRTTGASKEKVSISFPVPANTTFEWEKLVTEPLSFKYRVVEI